MGYILIALILAIVVATIAVVYPPEDYYKYRPAFDGMNVLEQLVLKSLREAHRRGKSGLQASEIARATGIDSKPITDGILKRLVEKKRVERVSQRGAWRIRKP